MTWATGEFVAAEVYPTLIVIAARALDHLGQADPYITHAADDGAAADVIDLRLWRGRDPSHYRHLRDAHPAPAPCQRRARYQVQGFIDVPVLNTIAPRGVPGPTHVPADVVRCLAELTAIPHEVLPATPADWPNGDDTITFGRRLSGLTEQIYANYRDSIPSPAPPRSTDAHRQLSGI